MRLDWQASYLLREMAYDMTRGGWREWAEAAGIVLAALAALWILCAWAAM